MTLFVTLDCSDCQAPASDSKQGGGGDGDSCAQVHHGMGCVALLSPCLTVVPHMVATLLISTTFPFRDAKSNALPSVQGLTPVHFSAQLEPCLAQQNTLHTLHAP